MCCNMSTTLAACETGGALIRADSLSGANPVGFIMSVSESYYVWARDIGPMQNAENTSVCADCMCVGFVFTETVRHVVCSVCGHWDVSTITTFGAQST